MPIRKSVIWLSVVLILAALIVGCGGSSGGVEARSVTSPSTSSSTASDMTGETGPGKQPAALALAACKRAVTRPASLSASSRREISELCFRINDVVEDNEPTMRAVCQELANAATQPDTPARKSVFATCYAEYAKTIKSR
jgi:hypothetical protein